MNSSKLKWALVSLSSFFIIVMGLGFYIVKSKINEDDLRKIVIQNIQKTFPKARVELGKINFSFGTSVSLRVDKLNLWLPYKNENKRMLSVKDVDLNIPIFSILMGGGAIEILLDSPEFNYEEIEKENNWSLAMKENANKKVFSKNQYSKKNGAENNLDGNQNKEEIILLPGFITNSILNVRLVNVSVDYRLSDKQKGKIKVSKFMLKNLGLETLAAYELSSDIDVSLTDGENIKFKSLFIGQFSLKDFLEKGTIDSKAHLKLSNFNLSKMTYRIPDFKGDTVLKLERNGSLKGSFQGEFEKSSIALNFSLKNGNIFVSDIKTVLILKDTLSILNDHSIPIESKKTKIDIRGSVAINSGTLNPNLSFSISPDFVLKNEGLPISVNAEGSINKRNLKLKTQLSLLGGEINAALNSKIDINSKEELHKKISNYRIDLNLKNLTFSKAYIQEKLYSEKKEFEKVVNEKPDGVKIDSKKRRKDSNAKILMPKGEIYLDWKGVKIDKKAFFGKGLVRTHLDIIETIKLNFNLFKGVGSVTHKSRLYQNQVNSSFNFKLSKLNLEGLNAFLPPKISEITGIATGAISGTVNSGKNLSHNIKVNLRASKGKLKGVNIKEYIEGTFKVLAKVPGLKGKIDPNRKVNINSDFEDFSINARFKEDHYVLNSFHFLGIRNNVEIKASGNLYPGIRPREGSILADIKESKVITPNLEKIAKMDALPMRFKGLGLELKPDYTYPLKKVGKARLKNETKKLKTKAKSKIKNEVNKLLKGKGKDKVKNLLKGLF